MSDSPYWNVSSTKPGCLSVLFSSAQSMPDTYWRLLKYRSMEVQKAPALSPGREARSVLDFSYFSLSLLSSFSVFYPRSLTFTIFLLSLLKKVTYFSFLSHSTSMYWQYTRDKTDPDQGSESWAVAENMAFRPTQVQCLSLHHACHCLWENLSPLWDFHRFFSIVQSTIRGLTVCLALC